MRPQVLFHLNRFAAEVLLQGFGKSGEGPILRYSFPTLIVRGPAAVQRLFALSAVDEAFEMVSDVPEALTSR